MPELSSAVRAETLLRKRVSRFFANHSKWKAALRKLVSQIEEKQWPAVVFGGVPRDLLVLGLTDRPRDVDIVLDDVSLEEISKTFSESLSRTTRFGGLNLRVEGWLIDIWPLRETWAFRELGMPVVGFQDLPKTTFLNVEAVAVDLLVPGSRKRNIYSFGFFEAVDQKVLEINFEPNPFPELCVIRSLIMAARLGFRIGPRLAMYIAEHSKRMDAQHLTDLQLRHYGSVRCDASTLQEWIARIARHVEEEPTEPFALQVKRPQQLQLGKYWFPTL